ncbi:MAG: hypothetical protein ACTFAK_07065 [Candidatus Electronema sp. VV]
MARKLSAAGAAAAVILLLAGAAAAQRQDDGQGAGNYETLSSGNAQGLPMPDMSGIQQRMQAQMMQQMTQQMQSASPAVQMMKGASQQAAPAADGMMPDVSGIQQQMQAQMMQQMTQQMQSASPAAQMMKDTVQQPLTPAAGQAAESMAVPDTMMRQNMQQQMQKVLGMNQPAPAEEQSGGLQIDSALAALKMDPSVQATINEKMMKIMEQTMRETFADPKMRQEIQQRFMSNGITPGAGQVKQP